MFPTDAWVGTVFRCGSHTVVCAAQYINSQMRARDINVDGPAAYTNFGAIYIYSREKIFFLVSPCGFLNTGSL